MDMEVPQYDGSMMMVESKTQTHHHMTMMIKGKRTKRQRTASPPLALTMASTSSTTTTTTTISSSSETGFLHMSTNSIEFTKIMKDTDEEDMANCLILLAQGQSSPPPPPPLPPPPPKAANGCGLYVYECKTCNRGFSSFQALGGHRASHKKPTKPDKNSNMAMLDVHHTSSTDLSLQIGPNKCLCNPNGLTKLGKVHECCICGAKFTSGQALGGHMRRHRSMPPAAATCGTSKKPKTLISLDLNLPAPSEDDHKERKFPFGSKDQIIVFTNSSSLVDCHF